MSNQFSTLKLSDAMLKNLDSLGYTAMTPIQEQSLPFTLEGRDLIAKAATGSGKTAAFGIALVNSLTTTRKGVQKLILCPTRELADQVAVELRKIARCVENVKIITLGGGVGFYPQQNSLKHGADIIVGTPGRILKHLDKKTLVLDKVATLVLDEADRMLDMGFSEEINTLLEHLPPQKQIMLFSATYPNNIRDLSTKLLKDPIDVSIETEAELQPKIAQRFYKSDEAQKTTALLSLLYAVEPSSCIVFTNYKSATVEIAKALQKDGFSASYLNGDMEQFERTEALILFQNGSNTVLVATDVAARGLDIKNLECIVNYDLPRDHEVYTHRIGRTGRAGEEGLALTLITPMDKVSELESYLDAEIAFDTLPKYKQKSITPSMVTFQIDGGRRQKVRAGDILGALCRDGGIAHADIGKLDVIQNSSFIAVKASAAQSVEKFLQRGRIKAKNWRHWRL